MSDRVLYRIYKLELNARGVSLIQHGRERCKWLEKLSPILWMYWGSNFENTS